MKVFLRIVTSKKLWQSIAGGTVSIILATTGEDYSELAATIVASLTGLLVAGQTFLDAKYGSPSDQAGQ